MVSPAELGRHTGETRRMVATARPIPHGEISGVYFDRAELERIKKAGNKPIDFEGFMSAHALHINHEMLRPIFDLLCTDEKYKEYKLADILRWTETDHITFPSKNVESVAVAVEYASFEPPMMNAIAGMTDQYNADARRIAQSQIARNAL